MKALLCERLGGPETLTIADLPAPAPGPGEVLVRVRAAALNFFDTLIIQGKYQVKPALPFSPGAEFAGEVVALGAGVSEFRPGARVMGWIGHGAARELVTAPASRLIALPDGVSDEIAAGLHVTYGTAIHGLKDRAILKPGETLAVLGAAGGVGLAAVEIGRLMGARVIALASSADKLALAAGAGADEGINYAEEDLKEALKRLTGGKGADVVFDPVGGSFAEPALRATGWGGRYLVVGFAAGEIPRIPLNLLLLKGSALVGVFWGDHVLREPALNRANMAKILNWVAAGALRPHIDARYRLDEAAAALTAIAGRQVKGKVLLIP